METKKTINLKLIATLAIVSVISFIFYWFQQRPAQIRSNCHKWIVDLPGEVENNLRNDSARKTYDALYASCLHKKGLK